MAIITGTPLGDVINATDPNGDDIRGLGGDDILTGGPGRDNINGNQGNDLVRAAAAGQTASGNDLLRGGQGADTMIGSTVGFGGVVLNGNKGQDWVVASSGGGDTLFGGQGDDSMVGGFNGSSSILNGDLGADVLYAGAVGDRLLGGDGNDSLYGGVGSDQMFGGDSSGSAGSDQFVFQAFTPAPAALNALLDGTPRNLGGFGGTDTINDLGTGDVIQIGVLDTGATVSVTDDGTNATITIFGTTQDGAQSANQTIRVLNKTRAELLAPGPNYLFVGGQAFTATTTNINDNPLTNTTTFTAGTSGSGGVSGVTLSGTPNNDSFSPTPGRFTDALQTTPNNDNISGLAGDDYMDGGGGNDTVDGGGGIDTIIGGAGSDLLTGGTGDGDTFALNSFIVGDIDTITDFGVAVPNFDAFLPTATFDGLTTGLIPLTAPVLGTNYGVQLAGATAGAQPTIASDSIPTFGYNIVTGELFFDPNGSLGGASYTKIAQLSGAPVLVITNFLTVVATI